MLSRLRNQIPIPAIFAITLFGCGTSLVEVTPSQLLGALALTLLGAALGANVR
jgi:hypothetical protein